MTDPRAARLASFCDWVRANITGDEKGEAQIFLDRLLQAFGHAGVKEAGATLEKRIRGRDRKGTAFADLVWKPSAVPSAFERLRFSAPQALPALSPRH